MRKFLRCGIPVALAVTLVGGGSLAMGQGPGEPPRTAEGQPGGPAGVERARNAGVEIPPQAAKIMEQAPAGSCLNDPTRQGCPAVKRIEVSPSSEPIDAGPPPAVSEDPAASSGVSYGPAPQAQASRSGRKARAAQAAYACYLKSLENDIIYVSGNYKARGRGQNRCSPPVTWTETYVSLRRYEAGPGWYTLDTASATSAGPSNHDLYARYDCDHDRTLAYDTQTFGYAVLNGIGYSGVDHLYVNHTCPA